MAEGLFDLPGDSSFIPTFTASQTVYYKGSGKLLLPACVTLLAVPKRRIWICHLLLGTELIWLSCHEDPQPANTLRSWAPLNQVTRLFYLLRWQLYLVSSVAGFKFHLNTHSLMFLPLLGQSQEENLRQTFNPHVFILADSVLNSSWHYLIFHVLNMCFELLKRQKPHLILNTIKWFSTKGKKIKEEEQYK